MKKSVSLGYLLLNIAVACYLFATGILDLMGKKFIFDRDPEIRRAVTSLFGRGDLTDALVVILAVLAIVAGVFVLIKMLGVTVPITELLLVILAIVWLVFIVMIDIVYPLNKDNKVNFIVWLKDFAAHLMGLAGLLLATKQFGYR